MIYNSSNTYFNYSDELPCVNNKCILLPICKHKVKIICSLLYIYTNSNNIDRVLKFFPNVYYLQFSEDESISTRMIRIST